MTRLTGLDLARALALIGMVAVNIPLAFSDSDLGLAGTLMEALSGRAAALFVVLAGIGSSLMTRKALQDPTRAKRDRGLIVRRALFLLVLGLGWFPLWPVDILHYYGVWMLLAALVFTWPTRRLLPLAGAVTLAFPLLLALGLDYEAGWNWETLDYAGFWTPRGFVRNLLFNGFHPVLPWFAFYLGGMWLGRQALADPARRRRLLLVLVPLWLAMEAVGVGLTQLLVSWGEPLLEAKAMGGVNSMPPMPQYIVGAGTEAMVIALVCIPIAQRFPRLTEPLVSTGQLALTHYVSHVLFLLYPLLALCAPEALELPGPASLQANESVLLLAMGSWAAGSILFSWVWRRRFPRGPMEWVMRRLTTPKPSPSPTPELKEQTA